jgi:hypothetical protein
MDQNEVSEINLWMGKQDLPIAYSVWISHAKDTDRQDVPKE